MSYDEILDEICNSELFEKLAAYVGKACFDPGEFGEVG
jgi:hypothetical protein